MQTHHTPKPEDIKPDLKHDNMEYSASTEGEDIMDEEYMQNEDGITADELEVLEDATPDEQAAALNSVETDRQADDDVIFDENDIEEEYEELKEDDGDTANDTGSDTF